MGERAVGKHPALAAPYRIEHKLGRTIDPDNHQLRAYAMTLHNMTVRPDVIVHCSIMTHCPYTGLAFDEIERYTDPTLDQERDLS